MIKEKILEINRTEKEAVASVQKAREEAVDIVRKARHRAGEITSQIQKQRRGIIDKKVAEAEKRGAKESEALVSEAAKKAEEIEKNARLNFDKAVEAVFEKVMKYGD